MERKLVVQDYETGGVDSHHPNIQLAAIAVDEDWKEVESFEAKILFDPAACDPEALKLNSYDPDVWNREAMPEACVVSEYQAFLRRHATYPMVSKRTGRPYMVAQLCGHNARFDGQRLAAAFKTHEHFCPADAYRPLDTVQLALWRFRQQPAMQPPADYKLGTLCAYFGIDAGDAHDALADVRLTAKLAQRLLGAGGGQAAA